MDKEKAARLYEGYRDQAFVRNMVQRELEARDHAEAVGEPVVTFSVRLPATDLARLELLGSYLGHKKTPFASMLLQAAVNDAFHGLEVVEQDKGRLDEFHAHMEQKVELEEGGSVQSVYSASGEGEVG